MRYVDGKPHSIDTVVISSQHAPEMSDGKVMKKEFTEAVIEQIIKPSLPPEWLKNTRYLVNPTGRFVVGGPKVIAGSQAAKSLSTPTAVHARTAAARFPAKIRQRSIARPRTPHAMWRKTSSLRDSRVSVRYKSRTRSRSHNR